MSVAARFLESSVAPAAKSVVYSALVGMPVAIRFAPNPSYMLFYV